MAWPKGKKRTAEMNKRAVEARSKRAKELEALRTKEQTLLKTVDSLEKRLADVRKEANEAKTLRQELDTLKAGQAEWARERERIENDAMQTRDLLSMAEEENRKLTHRVDMLFDLLGRTGK